MTFILIILLLVVVALLWLSTQEGIYHLTTDPKVWGVNIERETVDNKDWRRVIYTSKNAQMTVMSVPVGDSLGWEVHPENDQYFRTESGTGEVWTSNDKKHEKYEVTDLSKDHFAFVPKGVYHNVVNKGNDELKFYTIYAPPHHPPNRVDRTKQDELRREGKL